MDTSKLEATFIAGEKIYYEGDFRKALFYLEHDLSRDEAKVFLIAARETGEAKFEDDHEGQYMITYTHGKYFLEQQ